MTEKEIIDKIKKVKSFAGMTVNEMLYVSGLDQEFYSSLNSDKIKAEIILLNLKLDKENIDAILKAT